MRRQRRNNKQDEAGQAPAENEPEPSGPTKQQTKVADFLKQKCPTKQTMMDGHGKVKYFEAAKAIDLLMDSKFATSGDKAIFTTRDSVAKYLNELLKMEFFIRAEKITVKKVDREGKEVSSVTDSPGSPASKDGKKKKKIKLEAHQVQRFIDGSHAYVWIYDPTSWRDIALGTLVVAGSIGLCLFPLWPANVRQGVYYITMSLAILVGCILAIGVLRYIPFALIWLGSMGKIQFWLLPNLLEDVGILESFQPLYLLECRGEDREKIATAKKTDERQLNDESQEEFEIIDEDSIIVRGE